MKVCEKCQIPLSEERKGKFCALCFKEYKRNAPKFGSPEYRTAMSQKNTGRKFPLEFGEKITARNLKNWSDPEYKARLSKSISKGKKGIPRKQPFSSETCQRISKALKKAHSDGRMNHLRRARPEHSALMKSKFASGEMVSPCKGAFGDKNPAWTNGESTRKYPAAFNTKLKDRIKELDGFQCLACGTLDDLCVHHINHIKDDLSIDNLATACRRCNIKANTNREEWRIIFRIAQMERRVK